MFAKLLLFLSLALNFYLCFFTPGKKTATRSLPEKSKIQRTDRVQLAQSAIEKVYPSTNSKASTIDKEDTLKPVAQTQNETITEDKEKFEFEPNAGLQEDRIREKLKYDFNWGDEEVTTYEDLKREYREKLSQVFKIPKDHPEGSAYHPRVEENFQYYKTQLEFYSKLRKSIGDRKYNDYRKLLHETQKSFFESAKDGIFDPNVNFYMDF